MQIGPFSWSTHSSRKQWMVLGALVALVALTGVLAFTVMRVQNQQATVSRPRADAACEDGCRNEYSDCTSACADLDAGLVEDCRNACLGTLNGCLATRCKVASGGCTDGRQACRASYCGNPNPAGSNCYDEYCGVKKPKGSVAVGGDCHYDDECSKNNCSTAGDNSCALGKCVEADGGNGGGGSGGGGGTGGGGTGGTGGSGGAAATAGPVTVNVRSSSGGNYPSGGTVRMLSTSACTSCNSSCTDPVCNPNREKTYAGGSGSVVWSGSKAGSTYTFGFVGFAGTCSAPAGGSCTITVGAGVNSGGAVTVYVKDPAGSNYGSATTVRMTSTSACSACNSSCTDPVCNPNREKAYAAGAGSVVWDTSRTGAQYTFALVGAAGSCSAPAGGNCTITVGGSANNHLKCVNNACARVTGAGENEDGCTTENAACTSSKVESHLSCGEDNTCRRVAGKGTSNCLSQGSPCAQVATRLTCGTDNTCQRVIGEGVSNCLSEGSACSGTPTATYLTCGTNNTCQRVTGSGTSTCLSEGSSCGTAVVTHLTCGTDNTCKRVAGAGVSTCFSEGSACGQVNECWGNEGVNGQCYDVNGDGVINILDFSCMNNLWLADITSSSTPSCGGTVSR